ncbi:MAG: hypothetical protein WBN16_03290 [Lutimonas sp.]
MKEKVKRISFWENIASTGIELKVSNLINLKSNYDKAPRIDPYLKPW